MPIFVAEIDANETGSLVFKSVRRDVNDFPDAVHLRKSGSQAIVDELRWVSWRVGVGAGTYFDLRCITKCINICPLAKTSRITKRHFLVVLDKPWPKYPNY